MSHLCNSLLIIVVVGFILQLLENLLGYQVVTSNNEDLEPGNEIICPVDPPAVKGEYELVVNVASEENIVVNNELFVHSFLDEESPRSDDYLGVPGALFSDRYQALSLSQNQPLQTPNLSSSTLRSKFFSALNFLLIDSLENANNRSHLSVQAAPAIDVLKARTSPPINLSSDSSRDPAGPKQIISTEDIFWRGAQRCSIRVITIISTALVAYLIPNVGLLVSLTGASSGAALGLIIPSAIDLAQSQQLHIKLSKWRIVLNLISICLGIFGGVAGTLYAIRDILNR